MGGGAFAQARPAQGDDYATLRMPRMNPQTYFRLRDQIAERLREHFKESQVIAPKEAPGKFDYGDVDFLVAVNDADRVGDFYEFAAHVGAIAYLRHGPRKYSLAVRQNGKPCAQTPIRYVPLNGQIPHASQEQNDVSEEDIAQIDVEFIPLALHEWREFQSGYGDMANVIGTIVRSVGFTFSDTGIKLRMRELDEAKKIPHANVADSDGIMPLSSQPVRVMEFLGLDVDTYRSGFITQDELFSWLSSCRLLHPEAIRKQRGDVVDRKKNKRDMFRAFFDQWLPANKDGFGPAEGELGDARAHIKQEREKFLQDSVDFFDLRDVYVEKNAALVRKIANSKAVNLLQPIIAKQSGKNENLVREIVRAFRRWVGWQDGEPIILDQPVTDEHSQLYMCFGADGGLLTDRTALEQFVREKWEHIRSLARQNGKAKVNTLPA